MSGEILSAVQYEGGIQTEAIIGPAGYNMGVQMEQRRVVLYLDAQCKYSAETALQRERLALVRNQVKSLHCLECRWKAAQEMG